MKRAYTNDDKAAALAALEANGGNVEGTAAALDVPRTTLTDWREGRGVSPEVEASRAVKQRELADKFGEVARRCVESITGEKLEKAGLKDTMIAAGIAAEKQRLLSGEPTEIHKHLEAKQTAEQALDTLYELARQEADRRGEYVTREQVRHHLVKQKPEFRVLLMPGGGGEPLAASPEGPRPCV